MAINNFMINCSSSETLNFLFPNEKVLEAKIILEQKSKFLSPQDSLCKIHSEVISTYCYTCDELLCLQCLEKNTNHNDHQDELLNLTKLIYVKEINDEFYIDK